MQAFGSNTLPIHVGLSGRNVAYLGVRFGPGRELDSGRELGKALGAGRVEARVHRFKERLTERVVTDKIGRYAHKPHGDLLLGAMF